MEEDCLMVKSLENSAYDDFFKYLKNKCSSLKQKTVRYLISTYSIDIFEIKVRQYLLKIKSSN